MLCNANLRACWSRGCSACRCVLPVVCLRFSLLSLGSLVCVSQLPSLLIRASPLNMSACYNACRVAIFYPFCPGVLWVARERGDAFTARGTQTISLCDRGRNRQEEGEERWRQRRIHPPQSFQWLFSMRLITHTHTHTHTHTCSHSFVVTVTGEMDWLSRSASLPHQAPGHHVFYPVGLSLCCCPFPCHSLWHDAKTMNK